MTAQIDLFKGLTDADGFVSRTVIVTPELAETLLGMTFNRQREIRVSNVRHFERLISQGMYVPGTQIWLSKLGDALTLIDGQHRLHTVIRSGKAAAMTMTIVAVKSEEEIAKLYASLDVGGIKRSVADSLYALGIDDEEWSGKELAQIGGAARHVLTNFSFSTEAMQAVTRFDIHAWVERHDEAIRLVHKYMKMSGVDGRQPFARSGVLAVEIVTMHHARLKAIDFWDGASSNDGLRAKDPRKTLLEYFVKHVGAGSQFSRSDVIASARCWNAYVEGREMSKVPTDTAMPAILLTPFGA